MTQFSPSRRPSLAMVRRHVRTLALAGALVFSSSCDGVPRTVTGGWIGYDGDRKVVLALKEVDGEITGRGTITEPYGEITVDDGSRAEENVIIGVVIVTANGLSGATITGVFRGDRIVASMEGLAFETRSMVLSRWPSERSP